MGLIWSQWCEAGAATGGILALISYGRDDSYQGTFFIGAHPMSGTMNGFLDHTMDSSHWFTFRIDGQAVGEIGMETAHAGHFGVPLIMVTGDEAACQEAQAQFPGIVTVPVKRGLGRNRAHCLPPAQAQELIRQGAAEAVRRAKQCRPWKLAAPIELELTYYRSDYADTCLASRRDLVRVDARTVHKTVDTATHICGF